jgi:anti-sigma B factor antagonist
MSLAISLEEHHQAEAVVLSVLGEVDMATVSELEESIASLADDGYGLIIDLTATEFMDSTGLRLLLATQERYSERGRKMKVAVDSGPIARLLDVTGLLGHLDVYTSVSEAISA